MRKPTEKQKLTLLAWCDPDLKRHPAYDVVAKVAGLSGGNNVPQMLSALREKGYLDENNDPTEKGVRMIRRLRREYDTNQLLGRAHG